MLIISGETVLFNQKLSTEQGQCDFIICIAISLFFEGWRAGTGQTLKLPVSLDTGCLIMETKSKSL